DAAALGWRLVGAGTADGSGVERDQVVERAVAAGAPGERPVLGVLGGAGDELAGRGDDRGQVVVGPGSADLPQLPGPVEAGDAGELRRDRGREGRAGSPHPT